MGEDLHGFVVGAAGPELVDGEGEFVDVVYLFGGNGNAVAFFAEDIIHEVAEDDEHILGEEAGHVFGIPFDAVPVVFFDPVVQAAAADAQCCGYLRFVEICLEVQMLR